MGSSLEDLRQLPSDVRHRVGRELRRVQWGGVPRDWKPLKTIGPSVLEIRVHTQTEHRLVYLATFEEAIYVLHAFEKRSQKTRQRDIEIARRRLAELSRQRARGT